MVVEDGEIQVEAGSDQLTVSSFIAEQRFRHKLAVVANAQENRWTGTDQSSQMQILIDAGRRAHRARYRRPQCLVGSWRPQHASAGLLFPSGENVVFKLRSQSQPKLLRNQRNLVLHECAVEIVRLMMRLEVDRSRSLNNIAGAPSNSGSPDNLIPLQNEVVDYIKIKSVARFSQLRPQSVGSIIVILNLEIGSVAKHVVPAPEEIAPRYVLRSVDRRLRGRRILSDADLLSDVPFVEITLNS